MENKKELRQDINKNTGYILSIISIASFFIMGLGIILGIVGLILSIISYKKENNPKSALAIKLSIIGICLNLLVLVTMIVNGIIYKNYN